MNTPAELINDDFNPRMINNYLSKGRRQRSLAVWKTLHAARQQLSKHGSAFLTALAAATLIALLLYFAR